MEETDSLKKTRILYGTTIKDHLKSMKMLGDLNEKTEEIVAFINELKNWAIAKIDYWQRPIIQGYPNWDKIRLKWVCYNVSLSLEFLNFDTKIRVSFQVKEKYSEYEVNQKGYINETLREHLCDCLYLCSKFKEWENDADYIARGLSNNK